MDRRALILSGSIGQGHATVAEVCRQALSDRGGGAPAMQVRTVDCIELLGPLSARVAGALYRAAIARPALYDGFHFAHLRAEGRLSGGGDSASTARILKRLEREGETDGLSLALAVFATGVPVAAELARHRRGTRTVVFCTDATAHAKWVHDGIDLYVVTCELAATSLYRYRPNAEVRVLPPPVRPQFFGAKDQQSARELFGVAPGATCVLLVGGGWGIGPLAESAKALADDGHQVLAVAGSNAKLKAELDSLGRANPLVKSLGMCKEMASAISAADVVVSGAGQTCHEVHAVGRRLVVLDAVPGHGRENLLNEICTKGATAASPRPDSVARAVRGALKSTESPEPWPVSSIEEWNALFWRALEPLGIV